MATHAGNIHIIPKERVNYLWSVLRNAVQSKVQLSCISRRIQVFGASKATYKELQSRAKLPGLVPVYVDRLIILPSSPIAKLWQTVLFCLMMYTAVVTPYRICIVQETTTEWTIAETCVDCCFMLDIILTFFTAYQDSELKLVVSRRKIAWRYVRSWFIIDSIASVPFQLFEAGIGSRQYSKLVRLMRLPRLYKLLRLVRLVKMLGVKASKERRILTALQVNRATVNMLKFVSVYAILVHIIACLWYYTAVLDDFEVDTWPVRYFIYDQSYTEQYITSLYWVLTTIATVGYGDTVPATQLERCFAIIVMICCVGFYSYAISHFASVISSGDVRYVNLQMRLTALEDFARAVLLPDSLARRAQQMIM